MSQEPKWLIEALLENASILEHLHTISLNLHLPASPLPIPHSLVTFQPVTQPFVFASCNTSARSLDRMLRTPFLLPASTEDGTGSVRYNDDISRQPVFSGSNTSHNVEYFHSSPMPPRYGPPVSSEGRPRPWGSHRDSVRENERPHMRSENPYTYRHEWSRNTRELSPSRANEVVFNVAYADCKVREIFSGLIWDYNVHGHIAGNGKEVARFHIGGPPVQSSMNPWISERTGAYEAYEAYDGSAQRYHHTPAAAPQRRTKCVLDTVKLDVSYWVEFPGIKGRVQRREGVIGRRIGVHMMDVEVEPWRDSKGEWWEEGR
jgi:hypothetical protein